MATEPRRTVSGTSIFRVSFPETDIDELDDTDGVILLVVHHRGRRLLLSA